MSEHNSTPKSPNLSEPLLEQPQAVSRRRFLENSSIALVALTGLSTAAAAQQQAPYPPKYVPSPHSKDHNQPQELEPLPRNTPLDNENPASVFAPETDAGGQPPFKYPFSFSHKRQESGGWTRQVTVRDLPISKKMAGVQMRLLPGAFRELHWHVGGEWAYMIQGTARITAVDAQGRAFVEDVNAGDLWLFPGGIPHSIQGMGPDGATFLLVFNDGNFNEFDTFLLTDWMHHTPKDVLAKNFNVPESTFANVPAHELFIHASDLPRPLAEEKKQAAAGTGMVPSSFAFFTGKMAPTKVTKGGEVKIVDVKNFPVTNIAAAIVTLKPGGLRELHWHPNEDEWQYYVTGKGRMGVFNAGGQARTMDFQAGDVGYINQSTPHYIENTGDEDLVFLEVFPTAHYEDISLSEWLAHTPTRLVDEHLGTGEAFLHAISKKEAVVVPE